MCNLARSAKAIYFAFFIFFLIQEQLSQDPMDWFFSPPGMPARRAIYFADFFCLIFICLVVELGATSSQELLDGSYQLFKDW